MMDRFFLPVFAGGIIVGTLIAALIVLVSSGTWLTIHATAAAGLFALLGAVLTAIVMLFGQVREFDDRRIRALAYLRSPLSDLMDYAKGVIAYTKRVHSILESDDFEAMAAVPKPALVPDRSLQAFSDAFLVVDLHQRALFEKAMLEYQVLSARVNGDYEVLQKRTGDLSERALFVLAENAIQFEGTINNIFETLNEERVFASGIGAAEREEIVRRGWARIDLR